MRRWGEIGGEGMGSEFDENTSYTYIKLSNNKKKIRRKDFK